MSRQAKRCARALVIGPFAATGGMATVCRQMMEFPTRHSWTIIPFDNSKTTRSNRSTARATWVHLCLLGKLAWTIVRHRPDLVHVHTCSFWTFHRSFLDMLVSRCLLRPVVLHIHGAYFNRFLAESGYVARLLISAQLRLARAVIVLGDFWRRSLGDLVPQPRLKIVHNGVRDSLFGTRRSQSETMNVLFLGDLSERKAPEDLIRAVAGLPSPLLARTRVAIIGEGPPERRAYLEGLIQELGLAESVRLLGPLPAARVQDELVAADIHVMPSHAEGLPLCLLEAMAAGLPSIVTSVGAVSEVVEDRVEAFLIAPGRVGDLTDRLKTLFEDPFLRVSMGACARTRAQQDFSLERFHAAIVAVWRESSRQVRGTSTSRSTDPTRFRHVRREGTPVAID